MNAASSVGLGGRAYLSGTIASVLTWPTAILPPTYTLFHIAKYNNAGVNGARKRIFTGGTPGTDWLSGFWGGSTGVAFHAGWLTSQTDCCGYNWVLSTDQNGLYRVNGVQKSTNAGGSGYSQLAINSAYGSYGPELSDWAVAAVVVFNRTLSAAEITTMESWLSQLYFNDATGQWLGDRFIWLAYQLSCSCMAGGTSPLIRGMRTEHMYVGCFPSTHRLMLSSPNERHCRRYCWSRSHHPALISVEIRPQKLNISMGTLPCGGECTPTSRPFLSQAPPPS